MLVFLLSCFIWENKEAENGLSSQKEIGESGYEALGISEQNKRTSALKRSSDKLNSRQSYGNVLTSFPQRTAKKFMVFHHSKCWKGLEQLSVLQEQLHMEKSKSG